MIDSLVAATAAVEQVLVVTQDRDDDPIAGWRGTGSENARRREERPGDAGTLVQSKRARTAGLVTKTGSFSPPALPMPLPPSTARVWPVT